jgi:L-iditol 2-dehydrogenase
VLAVATTRDGGAVPADVPTPRAPAGGLLLRVRACGLCGSDVEKLGAVPAGRVLGHELAAEVVEGRLAAGTRVTLAHHVPCGTCARCRAGHEPQCESFARTGIDPGGFAELVAVSAEHARETVLPLPDDLSDEAATFTEPLSCVLRACEQLPPGPGLVVGCGSVGLLFCMVLGRERTVFAADPRADRRALAATHGARAHAGEAVAWAVVTAPAGIAAALAALEPGGTALVFAATRDSTAPLDAVYRRELTVRGVRSGTPRHLRAALALLASGAVRPEPLVTHALPLREFARGLELYRRGEALKVVFRP